MPLVPEDDEDFLFLPSGPAHAGASPGTQVLLCKNKLDLCLYPVHVYFLSAGWCAGAERRWPQHPAGPAGGPTGAFPPSAPFHFNANRGWESSIQNDYHRLVRIGSCNSSQIGVCLLWHCACGECGIQSFCVAFFSGTCYPIRTLCPPCKNIMQRGPNVQASHRNILY